MPSKPELLPPAEGEESTALAVIPVESLALQPTMDLATAKQKLLEFQSFVKGYLREGEDFGTIPGTPKPTLYKPGADKLCELYGLADDYAIESKVEDFEKGLFDYTIKCYLTSRRNGTLVSTGMGSCNSYEGRYRWRDAKRKCPACGQETIIKGKEEYGGGWLCWKNKGGCGEKYCDNDPRIEGQTVGKVQNEDIATLKNTILKMAKKRAKIDATLAATRSSGIFTQDVEDMQGLPPETPTPPAQAQPTTVAPPANAKAAPRSDPNPFTSTCAHCGAADGAHLLDCPINPRATAVQPAVLEDNQLTAHIKDVKLGTAKNGKNKGAEFVALQYNGQINGKDLVFCWHKHLHECLSVAKGHRVSMTLAISDYPTVEDVTSIDGITFKDGKPVKG